MSDGMDRELEQMDVDGFAREIDTLGKEVKADLGEADIRHLKRFVRLSNVFWLGGLLFAGGAALLADAGQAVWAGVAVVIAGVVLSLARSSRWLLMHHISHRGYDKVPGIPKRFTSKVFASGWRRAVDWPDWMIPDAWAFEHNVLHHSYTGEVYDPDLVERNLAGLRKLKVPFFVRELIFVLFAMTWRFSYYAPNTARALRAGHPSRPQPVGSEIHADIWLRCYGFYFGLHYVLIPALFVPFGWQAVVFVLMATVIAEVLCNLHTFAVVVPNHTGDDLYRFDSRAGSKKAFYLRQVLGSVNFRTGGDVNDFAHLWLNYQIEHHLWPDLPMLRYQQVQPAVKAICDKYGVPYVQQSVWTRIRKMMDVAVGRTQMRWLPDEGARVASGAGENEAHVPAPGTLPVAG